MTDFDLVAVGEALAVISATPGKRLAYAGELVISTAGAEANVARTLARLGQRVAWAGALGTDPFGDRIVFDLKDAGVNTDFVTRNSGAATGLYFKDQGPTGETSVYYYRKDSAASQVDDKILKSLPTCRVFHLSGITAAISSRGFQLVDAALARRGSNATISFDVNHRAALCDATIAAPVLANLANRADVVFVGLDEATRLWNVATPAEVRKIISGPRTLVVKDGPVGATSFDGSRSVFVATEPAEIVEAVGAGDAFAAGYLWGMLNDRTEEERLSVGHAIARRALRTVGDVDTTIHPGTASDVLVAPGARR